MFTINIITISFEAWAWAKTMLQHIIATHMLMFLMKSFFIVASSLETIIADFCNRAAVNIRKPTKREEHRKQRLDNSFTNSSFVNLSDHF